MKKRSLWWPILSGAGIGVSVLYLNSTKTGRNNVNGARSGFAGLFGGVTQNQEASTSQAITDATNNSATSATTARG